MTQQEAINELINRLEKRKKECFISPNPYYSKNEKPSEYIDIKLKIEELKLKVTK